MKLVWLLGAGLMVVVAAACGDDGSDFPTNPGGSADGDDDGNDGNDDDADGSVPDAAIDAAPSDAPDAPDGPEPDTRITGRVCLVASLLTLDACDATGAGGLTVTIANSSTTTEIDGRFQILPPPAADVLTWRVTGPNLVKSVVPAQVNALASSVLPAIRMQPYRDELARAGLAQEPIAARGAVVVRVRNAGAPVVGAVAAVETQLDVTQYDSGTNWATTATGAQGVAWSAVVSAGERNVTATPPGSIDEPPSVMPVLVDDGAITYVTATFD